MLPHIVVITVGGTIAMRYDHEKKGDVPAVGGTELVAAILELGKIAVIEVVEFSNIPSFYQCPRMMLSLAKDVEAICQRDEVHGVVITHGTDTLEETAYFLDLYLSTDKPVCVTGAMRTSSHIAPDGADNILSAVKVASAQQVRNYGVFVVMNSEINAARYVTKTHISDVSTFSSPYWGDIGHVDDDVLLLRPPLTRFQPLQPEELPAKVPILKIYTGMDETILQAVTAIPMDGLVIEGYGRGNVPYTVVPYVKNLLDQGIPIVVASRVPNGRTAAVYATEGGGASLERMGVMFSGYLNSQKARLKLMLLLATEHDSAELVKYFKEEEIWS